MSTEKRNTEMGILTGIAIILVVLGHLDMNELSVGLANTIKKM